MIIIFSYVNLIPFAEQSRFNKYLSCTITTNHSICYLHNTEYPYYINLIIGYGNRTFSYYQVINFIT